MKMKILNLKKSSVLANHNEGLVRVGTTVDEFAARELEALGIRDKNTTEMEMKLYTGIIIAVPIFLVTVLVYSVIK